MEIPQEMIAAFERRNTGKKIFYLPNREHPEEIVCELEKDPDGRWSTAVALIGKSKAHVHMHTREIYCVINGELDIYQGKSGAAYRYKAGDGINQIVPFTPHWAEGVGAPAEVLVVALPAWTPEDHILVDEQGAPLPAAH